MSEQMDCTAHQSSIEAQGLVYGVCIYTLSVSDIANSLDTAHAAATGERPLQMAPQLGEPSSVEIEASSSETPLAPPA